MKAPRAELSALVDLSRPVLRKPVPWFALVDVETTAIVRSFSLSATAE